MAASRQGHDFEVMTCRRNEPVPHNTARDRRAHEMRISVVCRSGR